jgi:hypothetical protein
MASKKTDQRFTWLAASGPWNGLHLETGSTYEAQLVDAEVLAEWIRTGAARMAKAEDSETKATAKA